MPDPRDIAAATELVDIALDRIGASEAYRKLHRARMISNEVRFARFERVAAAREARCRPVGRRAA